MKKCPYCGMEIQKGVEICKHCLSIFPKGFKNLREETPGNQLDIEETQELLHSIMVCRFDYQKIISSFDKVRGYSFDFEAKDLGKTIKTLNGLLGVIEEVKEILHRIDEYADQASAKFEENYGNIKDYESLSGSALKLIEMIKTHHAGENQKYEDKLIFKIEKKLISAKAELSVIRELVDVKNKKSLEKIDYIFETLDFAYMFLIEILRDAAFFLSERFGNIQIKLGLKGVNLPNRYLFYKIDLPDER